MPSRAADGCPLPPSTSTRRSYSGPASSSSTAPDPTRRRAPGWRSCCSARGSRGSIRSRAGSARGWTWATPSSPCSRPSSPPLSRLQLDVLVGRGKRIAGDEAEAGLLEAPPHPRQEGELVDGGRHRPLVDELLDAVERGLAAGAVELGGLPAEEPVDVGIAAVGEGAARDSVRLEPRGGIPRRARENLDQVVELLVGDALVERGALEGAQLGADAHGLQVADDGLRRLDGGHVAVVVPGVEAGGIAGRGDELPGAGGVEDGSGGRPEELGGARHDAVREPREAERAGVVDGAAVDGEVGRLPQAAIVPRRLRLP